MSSDEPVEVSALAINVTIPEAVKKVDELRELVKSNPLYGRLMDLSARIEGISRHLSVHAAGVVIAPGPLPDYVPVCTTPTKGAGQSAGATPSSGRDCHVVVGRSVNVVPPART